ncbi:hypothetical protein [Verrucosispora sp. WMMD573]|uniref:hypothetical protein n=1 Tax=Verrucosispora sp. WMMD573 TaxID=3015149 RepID=UPI00248B6EBC|nr:hypothetical protein [Verrucosispora sp. WMMD573]WBB57079.1 hypothetical protein O7601_13975 [Verrucosispora sp. WMMD573]
MYAEQTGFAHVHFHVVPRPADIPLDHRGPRASAYLKAPPDERVPEATMDSLAIELRGHLATEPTP